MREAPKDAALTAADFSMLRRLITDERLRPRHRSLELDVADVLGIVGAWLNGA